MRGGREARPRQKRRKCSGLAPSHHIFYSHLIALSSWATGSSSFPIILVFVAMCGEAYLGREDKRCATGKGGLEEYNRLQRLENNLEANTHLISTIISFRRPNGPHIQEKQTTTSRVAPFSFYV